MKIGFTGTQIGMSEKQKAALEKALMAIVPKGGFGFHSFLEFHHGDCIGADAEACEIAYRLGCFIIQHPPINPAKRAFTKADTTLVAKEYLARNHDIVDACELLIAAPKSLKEELRSGTWATIRYAQKKEKKVIILPR